ncbi:MAG: V-type ATPase 116kDa subunit family protein [Candidatus Anstonellales archaeon]
MRSEPIYRVGIFFVNDIRDKLIAKLHELGIVEVKESEIENRYEVSELHSLLSSLDYDLQTIRPGNNLLDVNEIDYLKVEQTAKRLKELYKQRKELVDKYKMLLDRLEDAEIVMSYVNYDRLPTGYKLIAYRINKREIDLKKLDDTAEVYELPNNQFLILILADQNKQVIVPERADLMYVPNSYDEIDKMRDEIRQINKEIQLLTSEINNIETDPYLRDVKFSIMVYLNREDVKKMIGKGKEYGLLECYVPRRYLNNLKSSLENTFGNKIEIIYEKLENSPVVFIDNPKVVKDFEQVGYQFGEIPNYKDIDPGIFYYIFFPIMFGFIVGDVVYGIGIMIIAKLIQLRMKEGILRQMSSLWFVGGIWSILFGLIFNEFAGFELDLIPTIFHRGDHVLEYMGFAIVLGFIHLMLAYTLNIVKHLTPEPDWEHIITSLSWMSILAIVFSYIAGFFQEWMLIIAILGVLIIAKEEGLIGIMEIPSLLSNLVSYLRLAILGIVGVILAKLINLLLNIGWVSLIFVIIFHILHIGLAILEASIQAGRLNIVEFRTKFFKGGGRFLNFFSINKLKGESQDG